MKSLLRTLILVTMVVGPPTAVAYFYLKPVTFWERAVTVVLGFGVYMTSVFFHSVFQELCADWTRRAIARTRREPVEPGEFNMPRYNEEQHTHTDEEG